LNIALKRSVFFPLFSFEEDEIRSLALLPAISNGLVRKATMANITAPMIIQFIALIAPSGGSQDSAQYLL
jgi:hypothetical protein